LAESLDRYSLASSDTVVGKAIGRTARVRMNRVGKVIEFSTWEIVLQFSSKS